jgi:Protein of unknown function (DUF4229)
MLRYSVLRILIFFGCLAALWLLGLRDRSEQLLLLVLAAAISMAISWFALRPFRDDYSRQISERLEQRSRAKQQRAASRDEQAEDAEARDTEAQGADEAEKHQGPAEYR